MASKIHKRVTVRERCVPFGMDVENDNEFDGRKIALQAKHC